MIGELLEVVAEIGTWLMSWRVFLWIVLVSLVIFAIYRMARGSSVPPVTIVCIVGIAAGLVWDWRSRR
jgi:hypothetical protein